MSSHLSITPPAAQLLGREIVATDPAGVVTVRFQAQPQFANRHGGVQGGLLAAMLDSATANALFVTLGPEVTAVTTRLDTRFLKPATVGELTATARLVANDGRDARVEGEICDSTGQVVARAEAELRILKKRS